MANAGRKKQENVRDSDGSIVPGLSRMTDGRWRVIETGFRFTEADPARAIARYYELTGQDRQFTINVGGRDYAFLGEGTLEERDKREQEIYHSKGLVYSYQYSSQLEHIIKLIIEKEQQWFWRIIGDEIRTSKQRVAELTGIEQIGYFQKLHKPSAPPSCQALEDAYFNNLEVSKPERLRVRKYWRDFFKVTGIQNIGEITPDIAIKYKDELLKRQWEIKTRRKAYSAVKRVLTWAIEKAIAAADCKAALIELATLKESKKVSAKYKSTPISRDDFHKLLDAAKGDNKALLLLCLNCGLYLQEVVRVKWDELEGGRYIRMEGCKGVPHLWQNFAHGRIGDLHGKQFIHFPAVSRQIAADETSEAYARLQSNLKTLLAKLAETDSMTIGTPAIPFFRDDEPTRANRSRRKSDLASRRS
jgi:hypothetical protein